MGARAPKILWVDDEMAALSGYEEELRERGFDLDFVDDVDAAIRRVRDGSRSYDLVIWDMAMPVGGVLKPQVSEANGGMTTGRLFHDLVRKERPGIKMLLFTNFRDIVLDWNAPSSGDYALAKRDYKPSRFAEMVQRVVAPAN